MIASTHGSFLREFTFGRVRQLHAVVSRFLAELAGRGWTLVRHPNGSVTWTSPLTRDYQRPGPHQPPQLVDLYADPPPLRPAPQGRTPWGAEQPNDDDDPVQPPGTTETADPAPDPAPEPD